MLSGRLIFIVHRDEQARLWLREAFAALDARVRSTDCVDEAIRRLEMTAVLFDVLVCDIALTGGGAFRLIRTIRAWEDARGGSMLTLALADHATPEGKREALGAGFSGYTANQADIPAVVQALVGEE